MIKGKENKNDKQNSGVRLFTGKVSKNDFPQNHVPNKINRHHPVKSFFNEEGIESPETPVANKIERPPFPTQSSIFDNLFSSKHDASDTPEAILDQYGFRQIETGLVAFVGDLQLKLNKILKTLPVFVLQTGDDTFLFKKKFEHINPSEVVMHTPRFVIKFESVTIAKDQNTMQYNEFVYNYQGINYQCVGRRIALNFQVSTFFVSPNFLKAMQNLEIMLALFSRTNIFTYEWAGLTFESGYSSLSNNEEYPAMEVGQSSKNMVLNNSLELQLQVLAPRTDSIKRWDEGMGGSNLIPHFNIDIKQDGDVTDNAIVDPSNSELPDDTSDELPVAGQPDAKPIYKNKEPKYPAKHAPVEYPQSHQHTYKVPDELPKEYDGTDNERYPIPDELPKDYENQNPPKYVLNDKTDK